MQLSARSIRSLCVPDDQGQWSAKCLRHPKTGEPTPMIAPFLGEKQIINGKSAGLSVASYDLRIAHDLTLEPHPGFLLLAALEAAPASHPSASLSVLRRYAETHATARCFALAHTIEDFAMPLSVSAQVCDKSTYARMGISCFNTFFDPGFVGNGTLEVVNLSHRTIIIRAGDPICQLVFNWVDQDVEHGYAGKYQYQPKQAVAAILEET